MRLAVLLCASAILTTGCCSYRLDEPSTPGKTYPKVAMCIDGPQFSEDAAFLGRTYEHVGVADAKTVELLLKECIKGYDASKNDYVEEARKTDFELPPGIEVAELVPFEWKHGAGPAHSKKPLDPELAKKIAEETGAQAVLLGRVFVSTYPSWEVIGHQNGSLSLMFAIYDLKDGKVLLSVQHIGGGFTWRDPGLPESVLSVAEEKREYMTSVFGNMLRYHIRCH